MTTISVVQTLFVPQGTRLNPLQLVFYRLLISREISLVFFFFLGLSLLFIRLRFWGFFPERNLQLTLDMVNYLKFQALCSSYYRIKEGLCMAITLLFWNKKTLLKSKMYPAKPKLVLFHFEHANFLDMRSDMSLDMS